MTEVTAAEARKFAEDAREKEWKLPSFGKNLYLGKFDLDLIYPQPQPDADAVKRGEVFLQKFEAFLRANVDGDAIERDAKIPENVIKGLQELGSFGMNVPVQYDGLGLSYIDYLRAMALASTASTAVQVLLSAHQSIGVGKPLVLFGSEEQKQKWLPLVAKDKISAFLLTEPDVGSDPARLQCKAVPTADGSGYHISGRKLWATNGAIADIVVVMARVPKSEGHKGGVSAFILPYDSPGITIETRNEFMGLRGIENSMTLLENVFVPKENLIAQEGMGLKIALSTLNTGRFSVPAVCAATTRWATHHAVEFGNERVQWGGPVGQHDAVAQKIAFLAATSFGLEATIDVCARIADSGVGDVRIEAALAKLYGSELGCKATDELIQVRGGRGYETADSQRARGEKPVAAERALRDMRINRIFEGSTEIMHLQIAREAVDQHLKVAGELIEGDGGFGPKFKSFVNSAVFYSLWFPRLLVGKGSLPFSYGKFGPMATHLRFVERRTRKMARQTFFAMIKNGAKLEQRQGILGRIVDIGAELFAIAATAAYAQTQIEQNPERRDQIIALADGFSKQARLRVDALFNELSHNVDIDNYELAQKALAGEFKFLNEGLIIDDAQGDMFGANYKQPGV